MSADPQSPGRAPCRNKRTTRRAPPPESGFIADDLSEEEKDQVKEWAESVGTSDSLQRLQDVVLGRGAADVPQILREQNEAAKILRSKLFDELSDDERWRGLAENPGAFDLDLETIIGTIRGVQKWIYGIPGHHLRKKDQRDKEIYDRRGAGKSFGEIAREPFKDGTKLKEQAIRQAYDRYVERQRSLLRKFAVTAIRCSRNPNQKSKLISEWLDFLRSERLV